MLLLARLFFSSPLSTNRPLGLRPSAQSSGLDWRVTRYGPNRVAADMVGNGEFEFWVIFLRIFGDILEDFWRIFEEFGRNLFVVRRLRTSINQRLTKKITTVASKQPRRSDLTSDLKSMAQTTYVTMFVWTDLAVLKLFCIFSDRKKERLRR